MNTCVRCGTQFAAGEDRCPFCSLPVAGDADVTRAAQDPGAWQQQQQPQQGPPSGEGPWQQPQQGQQQGQPWQGGQQWQGQQPPQGGWQGGPGYQAGQPGGWQGGGYPGGQPGGWQGGPPPGGQPWQGGGMPPKKGLGTGVLVGIVAAVVLVLALGTWGLVAAFSGDDDTSTAGGEETPTASEDTAPSASSDTTPSEGTDPSDSGDPGDEPTVTEDPGSGGSDTVAFDLASGSAVVTVTVSSPGRLRLVAASDDEEDIVMTVNDPSGDEVCSEDVHLFIPESCTIQAEVGEYEVVVEPYGGGSGGTGEVRIR